MTGPELDALIRNAEFAIKREDCVSGLMAEILVSEFKVYRAMNTALEQLVEEMRKEIEDGCSFQTSI